MTLAVATDAPARRRPIRHGWRPTAKRPFPTLGWLILDWTYEHLPSPANEAKPFIYTDEQAQRILRWYEVDPDTGEFLYSRAICEEAKGWGKSPWAASIALAEFCGPVCFDGWDAGGQPVGVPWGTGDRPPPWIQIAAVAEKQTENTYGALYSLLTASDHRAAKSLRIDDGRTRLYLRNVPGARLEPVTSRAGTREGQRVTFAILDETFLWTPELGGPRLAETIRRNATKMRGRTLETTNAPVIGAKSVAEQSDPDVPEPGLLHWARRPSEAPQPDWPKDRMLAALDEVYGDAWWAPRERIRADIPKGSWDDALRFWFNSRTSGVERPWMPLTIWRDTEGDVTLDHERPVYVAVVISPDNHAAGIAAAQRQGGTIVVKVQPFGNDEDYLEVGPLEEHLKELGRIYTHQVWTVRRIDPRLPEQKLLARGPEVFYHGAFFEGSAQHLREWGMALHNFAFSAQKITLAGDALMQLASSGELVHDGGEELTRQMGYVIEKPVANGLHLAAKDGHRAPCAFAAMTAVHRTMTAPVPPEPEEPVYGSFR